MATEKFEQQTEDFAGSLGSTIQKAASLLSQIIFEGMTGKDKADEEEDVN